ncbi:MAG: NAD(P)-binding domain-containing protein, partial [Chloroflexi bacterium]|nr:NAD(P)-binding domain-containing protein [Chloroflexota bacterium]
MDAAPRVAVVGAGAWGTTLAKVVARSEPVTLLCHSPATAARIAATGRNEARLPGIELPAAIQPTSDGQALASAVDLVILAVPSTHLRATVAAHASWIPAGADVLSVVKGLERGSLLRMSEVIVQAAGIQPSRVAALSGPNLGAEIARNLPASAVVASTEIERAERIVERIGWRRFRLYVNSDLCGV